MKRRKLTKEDFERMNLPQRLRRFDWQMVANSAKVPIRNFCQLIPEKYSQEGAVLVIGGQRSVGKSVISAIVAMYARQHMLPVYYTTAWDWREAKRDRLRFDEGMTVAERMLSVEVLVVDDCTQDFVGLNDYWEMEIKSLVHRRTQRSRITVLVSDTDPNPLLKWHTTMERCVALNVVGPDLSKSEREEMRREIFGG